MRAHDLLGVNPRRRRTAVPADQPEPAPDLLGRDFMPGLPNQRWAGDITYIPTDEGWLYLTAVLDVGSRRVLGYAKASRVRTDLVADCLDAAVATRGGDVAGVIFHSDRGCQYTSAQFAQHCRELGIHCFLGRTGICWDNPIVESFFGALKRELMHRHRFTTRDQARQAIFVWIQTWYNRRRLHSALGCASPEHGNSRNYPRPHNHVSGHKGEGQDYHRLSLNRAEDLKGDASALEDDTRRHPGNTRPTKADQAQRAVEERRTRATDVRARAEQVKTFETWNVNV